ncbi:hypothetical protein H8356DRAFT_948139 [Neocallimastix lanati (nom. inval.)]|nr:hypothetical protein H8356DRAFT_948139 [Neocallimastix sp. JGI-2020a]
MEELLGRLKDVNLDHTIVLNDNTTEKTGGNILYGKAISEKDDSRARKIIYRYLGKKTWYIEIQFTKVFFNENFLI